MTAPRQQILLLIVTVALFAGGLAYWAHGTQRAWRLDNDIDMRSRHVEFALFAQHIYPHRRVAAAVGVEGVKKRTVYPPYSYPMFAVLFWPSTYEGARVLFQALSFAALAVMMWYGARQLAFAGRTGAWLGAAVPFAVSGNCTAMALGQFSIICSGFLVLQIVLLQRNRPALAGLCWAAAMLKPQIGLAFVLLFVATRQWRGLAAGGGFLAVLGGFALWWTGVMPWDFWLHGVTYQKLRFVSQETYAAGLWSQALGLDPRTATIIGIGIIAAGGAALLLPVVRDKFTIETTAALCAVLGFTLLHHVHYDNLMLVPLLVPVATALLRSPNFTLLVAAALLSFAAYVPPSLLVGAASQVPLVDWIVLLAPAAALVAMLLHRPRIGRRTSNHGDSHDTCASAAATNPLKRGCGARGRERNSG